MTEPRLRVLHLNTERGWRGGERQALWLAEMLRRLGHDSYLAARPGEPLAERARAVGMPTIRATPATEWDPRAALRLRRAIRALRVDVVHAHTAHGAALAVLATRGTLVPFVVSRRVTFPLHDNPLSRWKYARAACVVAVSEAVRDVLVGGGIEPARIIVVPDGVDLTRTVDPAPAARLRALGIPAGAPLVVQVSQLTAEKDPLTFVRAVAAARQRVPALHALLIGSGPLSTAVAEEAAALGVADALHLAGYRTDAVELLATADVVTLSSRAEGIGSTLLDAAMLRRPIVSTAVGGVGELVTHDATGLLVAAGDAIAMGAAIARLLTERAVAERLADAAATRVADFSLERMAERTIAVYRRVLADRVSTI